jgi:hypothetical protein
MALSLVDANLVRQRAFAETRKAKVQAALKAFFSYWAQHKNNPNLQFVAISGLTAAETVIADAACKVHALFLASPAGATNASFCKMTDHASTQSDDSSEWVTKIAATATECLISYDGLAFANGVTMQGNTTASGGTTSAAGDVCTGFAIIGAP